MDAEGARVLARKIEEERHRRRSDHEPPETAPDESDRLDRPRKRGRRRAALANLLRWTKPLPDAAPTSAPDAAAPLPSPIVSIKRLRRPRLENVQSYVKQTRRVMVEGRPAVVTEVVCRKRVGDGWESFVVDSSIEFSD
jgi:hypothetical protein